MKKLFKFLVITPSFLLIPVEINTNDPKTILNAKVSLLQKW